MKLHARLQQVFLLLIAVVFSISLMFAFTELPRLVDTFVQNSCEFPGLDQGSDDISAYKSDLYISALHLRWIGYGCLALVALLIVMGFVTRRSSWAWAGAFVIFLPVFGQFAMSMFFLAGLGMLRVVWLPFWDISFSILDLGNIVLVPYWALMWVFRQFGIWAQEGLGWFFMASGAFLFTWGVLAWIQSRFNRQGVATSWVYRFSRHPQYLGWIIWTYGLIIYTPLINQMKKSWGVSSTLPWLLMTMIIIGICMMEEINMKKKYGEGYNTFRRKTPFLFPLGIFRKILRMPMWLVVRNRYPGNTRQVVYVTTLYTLLFIALSLPWAAPGSTRLIPVGKSRAMAEIEKLSKRIDNTGLRRERWRLFEDLASYGELAVPVTVRYLSSDNPENQEFAAIISGRLGDTAAIRPLRELLGHPWENVRTSAIYSLAELGDSILLPALILLVESETNDYPRIVIYNAFGQLRAKEAWPLLKQGAKDKSDWVKMAAVRAMMNIYPDSITPFLIPLFNSELARIRGDAAAIANQLLDEATLPYLEHLLSDDNYEVRFLASTAIRSIEKRK